MNPGQNFTELRWCIDVHILDDPAAADLRRMNDLGWIYLQVTDTLVLEIDRRQDPDDREALLSAAAEFLVAKGPAVADHSLLGLCVVGCDEDEARLAQVYKLIWPANDRSADAAGQTRTGRGRFRDALHVSTAIKYALRGFVTMDQKVLVAGERLVKAFPDFRVMSVPQALETAHAEITQARKRAEIVRRPYLPEDLPNWP